MSDLSNIAPLPPGRLGVRSVSIQAMGTRCRIQFRCADQPAAMKFMGAAASWLGSFERKCSRFTPNSLVNRINDAAGREWVEIDQEMELLLKAAESAYHLTEGLLNPAALPLTRLWAQQENSDHAYDADEITKALDLSNWREVRRVPGKVFLPRQGMGLDLDALGLKYAVDVLIRIACQHGIQDVLVQAGGTFAALGGDGEHPFWEVPVELGDQTSEDVGMLALSNSAACYVQRNGMVMDPRTGHPVRGALQSVAVVAPNCLTAGVHAASMLILGQVEGLRFAESTGMAEACLLSNGARTVTTRGFNSLRMPREARLARVDVPLPAPPAEPKVVNKWLARDLIRLWPWLLPVVLLLITFGPNGFRHSETQPEAVAATCGLVWMTFLITRRLWGHYRAHAAATMLMFTLGLFAIGWLPMPDMTLCFLSLAAIAALVHQKKWTFFTLLGLSFLVKGPAAVVVPASAALGWWLAGGMRAAGPWLPGSAAALALGLGLMVWGSSPDAGVIQSGPPSALDGPWWHFLPVLFLALMPWSLCTPRVLRQGWRRLRTGTLRARHGLLAGWLIPTLCLMPISLSVRALLLVPALIIAFCPPLADALRLWKIGSTTLALWLCAGLVASGFHSSFQAPATPQIVYQKETVRDVTLAAHRGETKALNLLMPASHTPSAPSKR